MSALMMMVMACNLPSTDAPHNHLYSEEITKAPTCSEAGEKTFTCSCGDSYTEAVAKLPHTEEIIAAKDATCTEAGLTEGKKCSVCDGVLVAQTTIAAKGHTEKTLEGKAATCTEAGLTEGKQCTVCNTVIVAQETIAAKGHTEKTLEGKAATCTEVGLTEGKQCTVCNTVTVAQTTIAALGHKEQIIPGKPATCKATGLTDGKKCSVCNTELVKQEIISVVPHDERVIAAVEPTCKAEGLTEGKYCYECGDTLVDQTVIPKLPHTYDDDSDLYCNVCGGERACLHAETVVVPGESATCIKPGLTEGTKCNICGDVVVAQQVIPATNHPNKVKIPAVEATCTEDGATDGVKCRDCGAVIEPPTVISAKGHTEQILPGKAPTCSEVGYTDSKICSVCGITLEASEELGTIPHSESDWTVTLPVTCTTDGERLKRCLACGSIVALEPIPAPGHVFDDDSDATCNNCDYVKVIEPTLTENEIVTAYDVYTLADKSVLIDFAQNVNNPGNFALTYSMMYDGDVFVLDNSTYIFTLGSYTDEITNEEFLVTVSYMLNGEEKTLTYTYKLAVKDSTANRLENGGFENGLEGWSQVGNIGGISSDKNYWINDPERAEGYEFGMDGDKMFSAYAPGAEERLVGTLTSSVFKIGGSGFVTFKIGAMRDDNYVYVDVVDADTKQILARYYNGLWAERTNDVKSGCTLIAYEADLSAFMGREVFFRISDNADSGYGLFFADSFVTYYESEPDGFNAATPARYQVSGTIYDVFNGSFELGNVQGWWNIGEIGLVTDAFGYWGDNIEYGKHGSFLFTGVESFGADTMREGNRGTLTGSVFEIGGTGYISFMLGGGGNELCYVQVIDAATGEVLARFRQQAQQDAKLIQYVADLSAHIGKSARIQVVDYASSGWGCVSFDNVVTYYASIDALPAGITANNVFACIYDVNNGSFENGLDGWHMNIWEAGNQNTLGWVESSEHDAGWYTKNDGRKDGNNLFTFCRPDGTNCENTKGELVSSVFTLNRDTFVSFRFGAAGTREVRVELVRVDGTVIATFYNEAPGKVNTEMFAYFYKYTGETADCFFRVVDDSVSNYGCFVVDDFRANLEAAPEGFIEAIR